MPQVVSLADPIFAGQVELEIDRLRRSGMLGRSAHLPVLFDYLVERSRQNDPPREVEIAQDVFGRSADQAVDDGISRVYVHRLRTRLVEVYRDAPAPLAIKLPHGEYRLIAEVESDVPMKPVEPGGARVSGHAQRLIAAVLGCLVGLLLAAIVYSQMVESRRLPAMRSALWSAIAANGRPTLVVEGDYYLFGEYDESLDVHRLIQDFKINSTDDLQSYLQMHPEDAAKYGDVHLNYIPFSMSYALMQLTPVFRELPEVRIAPASRLADGPLPIQNVIYIGLTSGLAQMTNATFASSRFAIGADFDEIVDRATRKTYIGQSDMMDTGNPARQYGILSAYPGPNNNRYLVIAGTGELALVAMAQVASNDLSLKQLDSVAQPAGAFEALYEIQGQHGAVTSIALVAKARRDASKIWTVSSPVGAAP